MQEGRVAVLNLKIKPEVYLSYSNFPNIAKRLNIDSSGKAEIVASVISEKKDEETSSISKVFRIIDFKPIKDRIRKI